MPLNSLISRVTATESFQKRYIPLLIFSVRSQLPNSTCPDSVPEIDWSYLISCASLFAQSNEGYALDIAFRVCQTGVQQRKIDASYRNACAAILDKMANKPAIMLAQARNYIDQQYLADVPFQYTLEITRKHFRNTIGNEHGWMLLNDFQHEVFESFRDAQMLTISAPTSTGKSFVFLEIIKNILEGNKLAKIIYVVPTRALIQQVLYDVQRVTKNMSERVEINTIPMLPSSWNQCGQVLVMTQERLQWLLNDHPNISADYVIVDEAQKIGDGYRGILLEQVLQQLSVNPNTHFIFASPMTENPNALLKCVSGSDDVSPDRKAIVSEVVTVNQNLFWISRLGTATTEWQIDLIHRENKLSIGKLRTARIVTISERLPTISYALGGNNKGNLVYANGAAEAEKMALQLKSLILNDYPEFKPSDAIRELIKLVKRTIHPDYALAEALRAGVAFHYGNMPLNIRNEIEEAFKEGDISYLVCTSTLVEGVNLPAKSIFIRGPQKGKNIPMNEMDFWNLAGRAGRQGKEFQGNIFCVDVTDETAWKTTPPTHRRKYYITSALHDIVEKKFSDLIAYINEHNALSRGNVAFDYGYTYLLTNNFRYGKLIDSPLGKSCSADLCQLFDSSIKDALKHITVPRDILIKNPGVNPVALQKLLEYFQTAEKTPEELIPPLPENEDAQEKYTHIIGRISSCITGDTYKLNYPRAILVTNWLRGYGLARIISSKVEWYKKNDPQKQLATIIRETMQEIENYARFIFLKYASCYIDVLKYYFELIDKPQYIDSIPKLSLWLEFGASKETQISLMSMGFTRATALEISELMMIEDWNKTQCIKWLKESNLRAMNFSPIILKEIVRVLDVQQET